MSDPHIIDTDFGSITVRNELPDTVTFAVDDGLNAQRVLLLQIDEAHQLVDALNAAIRTAHAAHPDTEQAPPVESSSVPQSLPEWPLDRLEQFAADVERETDPTQPSRVLDAVRAELDRRRSEQS